MLNESVLDDLDNADVKELLSSLPTTASVSAALIYGSTDGAALLALGLPKWRDVGERHHVDYYVDSVTGSDDNSGLTSLAPFRTVGKVNGLSSMEGKCVAFRCGSKYTDAALSPQADGIIFERYGSGAAPIFSGADVVSGWTAEAAGGDTIYFTTQATDPLDQVFYDATDGDGTSEGRLFKVASKAALAIGKYWWDQPNSRLYIFDDPNGHVVEVSVRDNCIRIAGKDDCRIIGLTLEKGRVHNLRVDGGASGTHIRRNKTFRAGRCGIEVGEQGTPTGEVNADCTIDANEVRWSLHTGILASNLTPRIEITNNQVHNNGHGTEYEDSAGIRQYSYTTTIDSPARTPFRPDDMLISGNTVSNSGRGGSQAASGSGWNIWADKPGKRVLITNNVTWDGYRGEIDLESCTGYNAAGEFDSPCDAVVSGNVGWQTQVGGGAHPNHIGIVIARRTVGALVHHNTMVGMIHPLYCTDDGGGHVEGFAFSDNIVRDNIFIRSGTNFSRSRIEYGAENANHGPDSGNLYSHNCFGVEGANFMNWGYQVYFATYAALEEAAGEAMVANIEGDPLFVDAAAHDYRLAVGSPCISAATDGSNVGAF